MKRITIILLLLAILTGAAACSPSPTSVATPDATPIEKPKPTEKPEPTEMLEPELRKKLESAFTEIITKDGMHGAVYAVYKGEEIYKKGVGEAVDGVTNSTTVLYGAASITKQFTAASVLQLYEDGKLDLDDTLDRYFPYYEPGKKITLCHLLCMRSGIPDFSVDCVNGRVRAYCGSEKKPDATATLSVGSAAEVNVARIREMFLLLDPIFKPGERFDYSDSNYSLLAAVVEQVSGMPFHDYVRQHIFKPLRMTRASFIDDCADMSGVVIAHTDRKQFGGDYYAVKGAEYGCGDLLIAPRDLYLWYKGLFGGEVIDSDSLKLMTRNYSAKDELGYGFGLVLSKVAGYDYMYHFGWIPSSGGIVCYLPDQDYCQVVLSNSSAGEPRQVGDILIERAAKLLPFQKQSKKKTESPTVKATEKPSVKATQKATEKETEPPTEKPVKQATEAPKKSK